MFRVRAELLGGLQDGRQVLGQAFAPLRRGFGVVAGEQGIQRGKEAFALLLGNVRQPGVDGRVHVEGARGLMRQGDKPLPFDQPRVRVVLPDAEPVAFDDRVRFLRFQNHADDGGLGNRLFDFWQQRLERLAGKGGLRKAGPVVGVHGLNARDAGLARGGEHGEVAPFGVAANEHRSLQCGQGVG